jgi:uncharacterized membrane protein YeaQ/YmgE (transglycosylase-associated protein family)
MPPFASGIITFSKANYQNSFLIIKEINMHILYFLLIGLVAGWLAGLIMKEKGLGVLGSLIVGCVGAFLGGYILEFFGIFIEHGILGSLIAALLGAILLLWIIGLIRKKK